MSQVSYGTITIIDTNDIESITVEYNRNQSSSNAPSATDSGWSTTRPNWAQGYYIWQRTRVHKSGTTADKDVIGTAVCITGSTGSTGAPGRGLTDTTTQYCNYGTGTPADNYSGWTDAPPSYDSSKPNYWVMITNTYSAAPTSEIIKYKDEALTKAVADAAIANSVAQHANEDAQGAMSQAAAAQQQVTQIDALLGGHFLWHGSALSQNTKSGARVVEQTTKSGIDVSANPAQWLHNVNIGANGIQLRYNEAVLAQLAATNLDSSDDIALKFYQPPTISENTTTQGNLTMALKGNALTFYDPTVANGQSVQATLDANGLKLLKGGIESGTPSENGYVYFSTEDKAGITINGHTPGNSDPKWRQIIGTKFGVDSEGKLYANGARISGNIEITSSNTIYTKNQIDEGFDVKGSASEVKVSADSALEQLDVVDNVVGANGWLFKYGHFKITEDTTVNLNKQYYLAAYDYVLTSDTDIDTDKTYYIRNGSGTEEDPYTYVAVDSPDSAHLSEYYEYIILNYEPTKVDDINPHEANLYELVSIDEVVADYVSSRLMSTEQGLWITTKVYDYVLTSDININTDKIYYIRSGSGTEENPYAYTIVDSPDSAHLSEYYERIANDNNYRLLLSSDGIYLYGPNGIISKFGENIDFSSEHSQHIGGENSYIEFDSVTQKINIVTDQLTIGNVNPVQKIEDIEQNVVPDLQKTINEHNTYISTQQDTLNTLTGYVDINSTQSYIRVGKKGADSYVQIDGADTKVAINIKGQDVAYMSGDRFYAPSAVVTTLYMKTELNTDNAIGTIGWIMRSNGHLSLKRVK